MFVVFYAMVVGLAIAQILPVATVLVFASMPLMVRVWKVYGEPKPAESPFPNPVWPLWFAPHSFLVTRRAGGLLILGMIVGAIVGW
jgi:1,4-dihydroxy-2-naphthoate polyprenyltransferase